MQCNFLTVISDLIYLNFATNAQRVHSMHWKLESFGEVGAFSPQQLLYQKHILLILILKQISPNINVKNVKKHIIAYTAVTVSCMYPLVLEI